jgi:hypothetical protein
MTIKIDTPEGIKTGSSVYQVSAAKTGEFLPDAAKRTWSVKGDAIAIDLSSSRSVSRVYETMLDGSSINNSSSLANSLTQNAFVAGRRV